jgi:hypothetical protein
VDTLIAVLGFVITMTMMITISTVVQRVLTDRNAVAALGKVSHWHQGNTRVLWGLILLAIAYSVLIRFLHSLTGIAMLDGSIGVAIGLYICAHPAANAVNLLFFERDALRHLSDRTVVQWLALNLLVLLAGWIVVFVALLRLLE